MDIRKCENLFKLMLLIMVIIFLGYLEYIIFLGYLEYISPSAPKEKLPKPLQTFSEIDTLIDRGDFQKARERLEVGNNSLAEKESRKLYKKLLLEEVKDNILKLIPLAENAEEEKFYSRVLLEIK